MQTRLQDANVQTMVGGAMDATALISRVEDSYALVDDLDENLSILDLKLRHMRADIAAFEARSRALQVTLGRSIAPRPCTHAGSMHV